MKCLDHSGADLYDGYKTLANDLSSPPPNCPNGFYDWTSKSDKCYAIIHNIQLNFRHSKKVCQEFYGGRLIDVKTKSMEDLLFKKMVAMGMMSAIWINYIEGTILQNKCFIWVISKHLGSYWSY